MYVLLADEHTICCAETLGRALSSLKAPFDDAILINWYIEKSHLNKVGKHDTNAYLGRQRHRWYTILAELAETVATLSLREVVRICPLIDHMMERLKNYVRCGRVTSDDFIRQLCRFNHPASSNVAQQRQKITVPCLPARRLF